MIYLKTILSGDHEVKFIHLNIKEAFPYVDFFIVCEFNRTHTGEARELIFTRHLERFSAEERAKIIYIGADVADKTILARGNQEHAHYNEQLFRGYFAREVDLRRRDIVISVDADEILFGRSYPRILGSLGLFTPIVQLPLHQFMYRINFLWEQKTFVAPVACRASFYRNEFPAQWRYAGPVLKGGAVGSHFSWCMTIDEMLAKLDRYSHQADYGHFAHRELLEGAIRAKSYPFDPTIECKLLTLNIARDREFFPAAMGEMLDDFRDLVEVEI